MSQTPRNPGAVPLLAGGQTVAASSSAAAAPSAATQGTSSRPTLPAGSVAARHVPVPAAAGTAQPQGVRPPPAPAAAVRAAPTAPPPATSAAAQPPTVVAQPTSGSSTAPIVASGGSQDVQSQLADLQKQLRDLKDRPSSTAGLLKEISLYCSFHRRSLFIADHAMALIDNLVSVARREGHDKADEFESLAEEVVAYKHNPDLFCSLAAKCFGSSTKVQAASKVQAGVKSYYAANPAFASSSSATRERHPYPRKPEFRNVKGSWSKLSRDQCARCYRKGHWARDCPGFPKPQK
ncbi:sal-like protein 3 [Branchiostoma floridae]|uniref:Sal-like protein 3 n=1 Tax=Branchiostoma floridae TaxID=7739 RepID=A0A9J7MWD1_BRAFL|nr:sal-like protein 3 [Branchiostoma floridae]